MLKASAMTVATILVAGCTALPNASDAVRTELAPTGKLRAGMNLGNALFTLCRQPAHGEPGPRVLFELGPESQFGHHQIVVAPEHLLRRPNLRQAALQGLG